MLRPSTRWYCLYLPVNGLFNKTSIVHSFVQSINENQHMLQLKNSISMLATGISLYLSNIKQRASSCNVIRDPDESMWSTPRNSCRYLGRPNEHGIPGIVHKNKPSISNMQPVLISWAYLEYSPSLATCRRTSRRIQFLHTSIERPTLIMIWLYFDFCMSYYPFWYFRLEQLNEHIWALIMSFPKFQPFNRYNA